MEEIEDNEFVASEHDRLVSAITKLDKTQHITEPTRNEPTNLNSEFTLIKRSNKLNLENVAKILENTSHHTQISKKLKKTQHESKVLSKPLEKPQAERIKRATGYDETKKKVARWDPVVARGRTVDYVSFPLKHTSTKMQPTGEFLSKLKIKSDLEKELEELDPPTVMEEEEVEEPVFPMTYDEMVEHRQHLAKMRAQQSYKAAKAKRQSKIKSKKYHRVLKKEKLKQELKEFEELQKKDPEEALRKLETLEKARALERHTLRHKNTGKWAKNKLIRAKYDKEVRQQLADQLAVSRGLTKKVVDTQSSDDEAAEEVIPDIALAQDPMNPWMMQRSDKSNVNAEFDFGYKKFVQNKRKLKDDSDSESNDETDDANDKLSVLKEGINKLSQEDDQVEESGIENVTQESNEAELPQVNENVKQNIKKVKDKRIHKALIKLLGKSNAKKTVATTNWMVESADVIEPVTPDEILLAFEHNERNLEKIVGRKLKQMRNYVKKLEKASRLEHQRAVQMQNETRERNNLEYLMMKPQKVKPIIDEELIETSSKTVDESNNVEIPLSKTLKPVQPNQETTDSNIDPTRFIEVKPKYLNTAITEGVNAYDQLDDDEQVVPRVNIEEVFEEDDVVDSFRQEKEDEVNRNKLEDISLSLPGWGSWGGKGVKPQKRKRNRFIAKPAPKMPRRDENKGDIIIREYKDPKLAAHKVKDVPFPFESVKDYEASIRAPLGNTFIPEKAHKKLIRPSVITKAGTIIEPMDEEELLVPKNRKFKNEHVLKLLGQK
ncbi:U3 small nucleolar RNA-associated protein 14 homolog A [Anticarsia gemmatalis]|uniref:U3 small nucleolar RNA-associated protein 14 homolog A n=1 Tax=Anticarsia gemmatalis TaxID=129554 RepID=UPI003F75FCE6